MFNPLSLILPLLLSLNLSGEGYNHNQDFRLDSLDDSDKNLVIRDYYIRTDDVNASFRSERDY
jgi:hypothetical protein